LGSSDIYKALCLENMNKGDTFWDLKHIEEDKKNMSRKRCSGLLRKE